MKVQTKKSNLHRLLGVAAVLFTIANANGLTLGVAGGFRYINYAEKLDQPLKSTQHGVLPGFTGYVIAQPNGFFLKASVDYARADLTYDGTTQPPQVVAVTSTDPHSFLVVEGQAGIGLGSWFGATHTYLYTGLSYRVWHRDLSNPNETYRLITLPVGIRFDPTAPTAGSVGFDLSFRTMFHGNVGVVFASDYDPLTVPVKRDYGVRAEVPIILMGGSSFRLVVTPWFELSKIKQGDPVALQNLGIPATQNGQELQVLEPSSRTYQYGAMLALEVSI